MESQSDDVFIVKWTKFKGHRVPFLLQNSDGQCPLICLSNILFLNKRLQLPKDTKRLHFDSLCTYISSALPNLNTEWVKTVLVTLKGGLIFNCKFDSTRAYIDSNPKELFKSFNIPIKHGWIADPIAYGSISNLNYDELLDKLAIYQCKLEEDNLKLLVQKDFEDKQDDSQDDLEQQFHDLKLDSDKNESTVITTGDLLKENAQEEVTHDASTSKDQGPSDTKIETRDVGTNTDGNVKYRLKTSVSRGQTNAQSSKKERDEPKADDNVKNTDNLNNSNNVVTNPVVKQHVSEDFDDETATLALEFLDRYATQITEYGMKVLKHEIKEKSLVALYRNNHFLVATMYDGQIFTLVTDSSFYEHQCVWESLESSEYFDENFKYYLPKGVKMRKSSIIEKCKKAFKRKSKK